MSNGIVNTINPAELFNPLIGQLAWGIKRGYGSCLMMEFGEPHLQVRNPIVRPDKTLSENSQRRHVYPSGRWHLLIPYANWDMTAFGRQCNCNDDGAKVDEVMRWLNGQILTSVVTKNDTLAITFDLGGTLSFSMTDPSSMPKYSGLGTRTQGLLCPMKPGLLEVQKHGNVRLAILL